MHDSVRVIFPEFSRKFEGYVHYMYLDVKGLVTIGIGNLIDAEGTVKALPFKHEASGVRATPEEIVAEWRAVKARQDLKTKRYTAFQPLTRLRLSDADIADLVRRRLAGNEQVLKEHFPDFEAWPADAQLAVLSVAWAVGAAFAPRWPKLTAACRAGDFRAAAEHCKLREQGNPGVIPRNEANVALFGNAAVVAARGLERSELFYPGRPDPGTLHGVA